MRRLAPLAAALAVLCTAGCGSGAGRRDVTLWITRDRGATLLEEARVRSNLTAAQALEGEAKVGTRYSGEFVQSIDGLSGGDSRDWFYYVNGYAADTSAADYLLRPGDVEWWDFRHWGDPGDAPLAAGAFPEPFLHGYDGKRRVAVVRYGTGLATLARALAREVHARSVAPLSRSAPRAANLLVVTGGAGRLAIRYRAGHGSAGDPVEVDVAGPVARALAGDPHRYAHRYSVP